MAKKKTSWKHPHKVVVHENRWLAWTISLAIVACAALIGHIQISEIYFESQMAQAAAVTSNWVTFNHSVEGYSIKHPRSWGVESDGPSSISFVNLKDVSEYVSVTAYKASEEKQVRATLFTTREEDIIVSGTEAVRITHDQRQPEDVIMVKKDDRLFVLRGKGENFDRISKTFRFHQKLERI
jgi:hypothetical protein